MAALLLYDAIHGCTLLPMAPTLVSGTFALENCGFRFKACRYFTTTILMADNANERPGQACARWPYVETRNRLSSFHTLGSGSTPSYLAGSNSCNFRSDTPPCLKNLSSTLVTDSSVQRYTPGDMLQVCQGAMLLLLLLLLHNLQQPRSDTKSKGSMALRSVMLC